MKKSIILEIEDGKCQKLPKKYRHLYNGNGFWTEKFLSLFGYSLNGSHRYKFIVSNLKLKGTKKVIVSSIIENSFYNDCKVYGSRQRYYLPCGRALHIFFGKTIPKQFYLRIIAVK